MRSPLGAMLYAAATLVTAGSAVAQTATANSSAAAGEGSGQVVPSRELPPTLMFSIDELNEIRSRAATSQDQGTSGNPDAIENASLYLSTIVYYGPNDWTIWINGLPISPGQDFQSMKVTDIGPRFVELLVPLSAQGMRPVRLEPNQSFIVKSGAVVEGPW